MTLQSITIDQPLKVPAASVWARISTPEGIARWWAAGDIAPVVGHEFTLDMGNRGNVPCRVIEVEPNEKLAYTFADFELHWTILPHEVGCLLRLEQRGFDLSRPEHQIAFKNMPQGWKSMILPQLADSLEGQASGSSPENG